MRRHAMVATGQYIGWFEVDLRIAWLRDRNLPVESLIVETSGSSCLIVPAVAVVDSPAAPAIDMLLSPPPPPASSSWMLVSDIEAVVEGCEEAYTLESKDVNVVP